MMDRTQPPAEPDLATYRNRIVFAAAMLGVAITAVALRMAGPSDIEDHAQTGPIDHIVDITANGAWLMQQDATGRLASKPPMYPWVGALIVKTLGVTQAWTFKLPSLLAFVGVTWLTFDLARRRLGVGVALLAAGMWTVNAASYKLMYLARPDMLLTLWIMLGVWCVERLRTRWASDDRPWTRSEAGLTAAFWLAVGAAALTKGPPALILPIWLLLTVAHNRAWRGFGWRTHTLGFVAAVAILLAWLIPTLQWHPEYLAVMRYEVVDRVTGTGSGAERSSVRWSAPGYLFGRFAPWSMLMAGLAVAWWRHRHHTPAPAPGSDASGASRGLPADAGWTLAWVVMVVGFFMLSSGLRADYLLPAYPVAAIAAAAMVAVAVREPGAARVFVHVMLGGGAIAAIVLAGVGVVRGEAPLPLVFAADGVSVTVGGYVPLLWTSIALSAAAGCVSLWLTHGRRYMAAAMALAFAVAGVLCLDNTTLSRAARFQAGDRMHGMVRLAQTLAERDGVPVIVYRPGRVPMQAMLGRMNPHADDKLARLQGEALLLTSELAWREVREAIPGRVLMASPSGREYRVNDQTDPGDWLLVRVWADTAGPDAHEN
jgi:4-amino-4-deoxy-L-arabinose transferase-like glycosyltransferase